MRIEKKFWQDKRWISVTVAICIGVVVFLFLSHLPSVAYYIGRFLHIFRPVFLGIAFAYVLNPVVRFFESRVFARIRRPRPRHGVSVACSVILVLFLLVLLGFFLIPQIISSVTMFVTDIDVYTDSAMHLSERVGDYLSKHGINISGILHSVEGLLTRLQDLLPSGADEVLDLLRNVGSHILDALIAIILSVYFLLDRDRLMSGIKRLLQAVQKPAAYKKTADFLTRGHKILIRYILFDLLDAFIVGVANLIFMTIAGLPLVVLVSTVVAVTNLAPTFGPIVGGAIGAFLLLLIDPWYALYFLIFTIILQSVDGYILKPRLFSDALGVPGVIVLICILIGGKLFGVWGILLAIPFAAIVYYALREAVERRLSQRQETPEEAPEPSETAESAD